MARSSLGPGLDGILVIDKPIGPTSHDIVGLVRRLAATRRVGHGGTLDPFASGVLPVFLGRATRVVEFHLADRKAYRATVCFGANEQDWSDVVRLPDKTFAVAWEDDISYYDQVYVRRLARDGKSMGTMMRLHRAESSFMPDRVSPRIAVFGSGIAATFGDRHRSLGFDAVLKVVGAKWDEAAPWKR